MTDQELIRKVRSENDSEALIKLVEKYRGIIHNVRKKFYVRAYDMSDWEQDGLIICYQSCCTFDLEKGKSFGSFFKTNLTNHACSLLRHELAKIREPYQRAVSYENLVSLGMVKEKAEEIEIPMEDNFFQNYFKSLSQIEMMTFFCHMGLIDMEELYNRGFTKIQIQQAKYRCKKKLLDELGE